MQSTSELVQEAAILLQTAMRQGVQVPKTVSDVILAAPDDPAALENNPGRERFYNAYQQIVALAPVKPSQIEDDRKTRLKPRMIEAHSLLSYAAANGKQIEDDIRKALIETAQALDAGNLGPSGEDRFYKAYQELTRSLAPVTSETLKASETRVPGIVELLDPTKFPQNLKGITAGRFVHFVLFVAVLFCAGLALGHYATGSTALERYENNRANIRQKQTVVREKGFAIEGTSARLQQFPVATKLSPEEVKESERVREEERKYSSDKAEAETAVKELEGEQASLRDTLDDWLKEPCKSFWTGWMCVSTTADVKSTLAQNPKAPAASPVVSQNVFLAETARDRMAQIILPMLLGLLGAYTYVLRNLSVDIRNRSFAPGSIIHSLIRLSLGALAGIASGWLLKTQDVTAFSSLPSWALAFVAGYSVELVFSAMDRIIAAFTTRPN